MAAKPFGGTYVRADPGGTGRPEPPAAAGRAWVVPGHPAPASAGPQLIEVTAHDPAHAGASRPIQCHRDPEWSGSGPRGAGPRPGTARGKRFCPRLMFSVCGWVTAEVVRRLTRLGESRVTSSAGVEARPAAARAGRTWARPHRRSGGRVRPRRRQADMRRPDWWARGGGLSPRIRPDRPPASPDGSPRRMPTPATPTRTSRHAARPQADSHRRLALSCRSSPWSFHHGHKRFARQRRRRAAAPAPEAPAEHLRPA